MVLMRNLFFRLKCKEIICKNQQTTKEFLWVKEAHILKIKASFEINLFFFIPNPLEVEVFPKIMLRLNYRSWIRIYKWGNLFLSLSIQVFPRPFLNKLNETEYEVHSLKFSLHIKIYF
jgi:hypothetical protein